MSSAKVDQISKTSLVDIAKWGFVLAILVLSFISVYFDIQTHFIGYDPLSVKLYEDDYIDIDSWSFLHVIFFGMIPTYLLPDYFGFFFLFGVLWELVEWSLTAALPDYSMRGVWEERFKNAANDLVFNFMGLVLGLWLRRRSGQQAIGENVMRVVRWVCLEGSIFLGLIWAYAMQYPYNFEQAFMFGLFYYILSLIIRTVWFNFTRYMLREPFVSRLFTGPCLIVFGVLFYFLVERVSSQAIERLNIRALKLTLDDQIPYLQFMWIPYLFFFPWAFLVAIFLPSKQRAVAGTATYFGFFGCQLIHLLFPIPIDRPHYTTTESPFFQMLHQFVHEHDMSHNTLPSIHACLTFIVALEWVQVQPVLGSVTSLVIIVSTLFTKQHTVIDVIAGLIAGYVSVQIAEWYTKKAMQGDAELAKKLK